MSLLLLFNGCALTTLMTQGRSLPTIDGAIEGPGLAGQVEIMRDGKGIPHVRAKSETDATYAIGYVHAQDRQFQMDMARRLAYGHMSELVGPSFADFDAFMQGLDLQERAKQSLRSMDPDTRFQLAAYAQGVNAGVQTSKAPPVEFRLLDDAPRWQDWTPVDSMALVYLQSWGLASGHWQELVSFMLRDSLDRSDVDALFRTQPSTPKADPYWKQLRGMETGAMTSDFLGFGEIMMGHGLDGQASNAWAVGPQRSKGEAPILANDPHLPVQMPAVWYIVEAKGGDLHAAGGTMPGLPWVLTGHNEHLAWGVTNLMGDYVDYVVLERSGDKGYLLGGEEKQLSFKEISVKLPKGSHKTTQVWTEIGPVISEMGADNILVMRWTALEVDDQSPAFLRALNRSQSVEQVLDLGTPQTVTALNLVLADTENNIAHMVVGALPLRMAHTGRLPYPGSSEYHGWEGYHELLPLLSNPKSELIVSANNQSPETEGVDSERLAANYMVPWRADRIEALLRQTDTHSLATIGDVQMDTLDTHAQLRVPELIADLEPKSVGGKWVYDELMAWDFGTGPRMREPLVWAELQKQLITLALEEKGLKPDEIQLILSACGPGSSLLDVPGGLAHFVTDPDSATRTAMLRTYDALALTYGEDSSRWEWGQTHILSFEHPFGVEVLGAGDFAAPGASNTVNAAAFDWSEGYKVTYMPSIRVITPLNNPGQGVVVLPPGQSGNSASPNYQDQLHTWKTGGTVPLWFDDKDVQRAADNTLVLSP